MIERFQAARRDPLTVVLEGFHAVKHAMRFGAQLSEVVAADGVVLQELCRTLAPDVAARLSQEATIVGMEMFRQLSPVPHPTGVVAIARRPIVTASFMDSSKPDRPIVLLDDPRNFGNIGAAIRVAAAAQASGVVVVGDHDPWHPDAIKGAAGLQFALPVLRLDTLPTVSRQLVAVDADGDPGNRAMVEPGALLAFGSERCGLSSDILNRAKLKLALPMRPGVSSLNLATSVAAVLYAIQPGIASLDQGA